MMKIYVLGLFRFPKFQNRKIPELLYHLLLYTQNGDKLDLAPLFKVI